MWRETVVHLLGSHVSEFFLVPSGKEVWRGKKYAFSLLMRRLIAHKKKKKERIAVCFSCISIWGDVRSLSFPRPHKKANVEKR